MVIENVSQRGSKFDEMSQNVEAIENYLKIRPEVLKGLRSDSNRNFDSPKGGNPRKDEVTSTDISFWIDKKTEEVISHDVRTWLKKNCSDAEHFRNEPTGKGGRGIDEAGSI